MDWTPQCALRHSLEYCDQKQPDAIIIIALHNEGDRYDTSFSQSGMKMSEVIALLEIQKQRLLQSSGLSEP